MDSKNNEPFCGASATFSCDVSLRNKNDHINTLHPAIIQHTIILKIIAVLHSMFLNSMVFTNDMVSMQCRCATCSDKRISDLGG